MNNKVNSQRVPSTSSFANPAVGIYSVADAQDIFDWWLPAAADDRARLLARELRRRKPQSVALAIVYGRDGGLFGITPVAGDLYGFTVPPPRELTSESHASVFSQSLLRLAADLPTVSSLDQLKRVLFDYVQKLPTKVGHPTIVSLPPVPSPDEHVKQSDQASILGRILSTYQDHSCSHIQVGGQHLPPQLSHVKALVNGFMPILYPGYFGPRTGRRGFSAFICRRISSLQQKLTTLVRHAVAFRREAEGTIDGLRPDAPKTWTDDIVVSFFERLPDIRRDLEADVVFASTKDPALPKLLPKTYDHHEMLLAYPGLWAVAVYRLAHQLYKLGVPYIPRMMTEYAHVQTGIDIHPGAAIAAGFFIDHGTGVVVGQTSIIEPNVVLYQGVTLGAQNFPVVDGEYNQEEKRHPTIKTGTTIFANAAVLGGKVVVGEKSTIGANVSLRVCVDPGSVVRVPHSLRELSISGTPIEEAAAEIVLSRLKNGHLDTPHGGSAEEKITHTENADPEAYLPKEFRRTFSNTQEFSDHK